MVSSEGCSIASPPRSSRRVIASSSCHLPLATDTRIGDALAERFCRRIPEAIRLPTLPVGCSSEHWGFSGTLSLSSATFAAVLNELVTSLAACGFLRVFLFSAHGGNFAPLAHA